MLLFPVGRCILASGDPGLWLPDGQFELVWPTNYRYPLLSNDTGGTAQMTSRAVRNAQEPV